MNIFKYFKRNKDNENKQLKLSLNLKDNQANEQNSYYRQYFSARDIKKSVIIQISGESAYADQLVEQKIYDDIDLIKKCRFYNEFDVVTSSVDLARKLVKVKNVSSSSAVSYALAWCSRLLSLTELSKAQEYLDLAKESGSGSEIKVAEAFICSQKGDIQTALSILSSLNLPLSYTASLMIISGKKGAKATIEWMENVGISIADLDSDGKFFLLTLYLQQEQWKLALQCVSNVTKDDLEETPALNHILAIIYLISVVPYEFRTMVINQVPLQAADFPLAADLKAIEARNLAHCYFTKAAEVAEKLNLINTAKIHDEYALWLELKDPNKLDQGKKKLEILLRNQNAPLRLINIGLQFGINFDLEAVDRKIKRQIALFGVNYDTAIARFALAFTKKEPSAIAYYIECHYDELIKYLDEKYIKTLQIDMYSQAGMPQKAKKCLEILIKEGLNQVEINRLKRIISQIEGTNSIELLTEQFKETDLLGDLMNLVIELEIEGRWDGVCEYGEILFKRTRSLRDAEIFVEALSNIHNYERIKEFSNKNYTLIKQSVKLHMLYCWALYYEGDLLVAHNQLLELNSEQDDLNYRTLLINIGIASGDWNSLTTLITNEYLNRHKRSANELLRTAQLALQLGSPHARELLYASVDKSKEDPEILISAYFLATKAGWENDEKIFQWLKKSLELSGKDGPVQKISLKDMMDMKPNWENRESEIWHLLRRGNIPMFLGAESLNRTLIQMMLYPAMANQKENDLRRRGTVYAYSGNRQITQLDIGGVIAIDATALLTLSFLNLLEVTLDVFDTVFVPHSTLAWLFEEKSKASFHQPSRIEVAHKIQHLFSTGVIEKLQNSIPYSEMSELIGNELAALIIDAENTNYNDNKQRIVVRPYPVHRISSLMDEEADLTMHETVMSSCQAIVEKLREMGQITTDEAKKAKAYLQLQEKPWPNQPKINDGAILYLDQLTLDYFVSFGIMEKLKTAGFRLIVYPAKISEANEFISYESISDRIDEVIEYIRSFIYKGIQSGKIRVGKKYNFIEEKRSEYSFINNPIMETFSLLKDCEGILIDDRFVNQHGFINESNKNLQIFSTLDFINTLVLNRCITTEEGMEYKTKLRRSGYCFIPVSDEELEYNLNCSKVNSDNVIETAELKAIRENILHVRMRNLLEIPKEELWLNSLLKTYEQVLNKLWKNDANLSDVRILSNWIISQIDIRKWVHNFEKRDNIVKETFKTFAMMLLTLKPEIENKKEYWSWIEDKLLIPIKEQDSDLYDGMVKWYRDILFDIVEKDMTEFHYTKSELRLATLQLIPPMIKDTLFEDKDFLKEYGFHKVITIDNLGVTIKLSEIYDAIREIYSGVSQKDVIDGKGEKWSLRRIKVGDEEWRLELNRDEQCIMLHDLCGLFPDRCTRLNYFNHIVSNINLDNHIRERWNRILSDRSLTDEEVDMLEKDIMDTPVKQMESIRSKLMTENCNIDVLTLVPKSRKYYERLVGRYDGSSTIKEYAAGNGKTLFKQLSSWQPYNGFLISLLLSSHSALTTEIKVDQLNNNDFVRAMNFLEKQGDMLSKLGAIEVGLRVIPLIPEIQLNIVQLIKQINNDNIDEFNLLSSLFILVDGELSRIRLFKSEPPFYRRLVALTQVALIHRQLIDCDIDINIFCKKIFDNWSKQYYLQSLVDMRIEPRWEPEFAQASLIKARFLNRIIVRSINYKQNITDEKLANLIAEICCQNKESYSRYLPGPLEGFELTNYTLPNKYSEVIESELNQEEVSLSSFITLINTAHILGVSTKHAELAVSIIKSNNYQINKLENRDNLLYILNGIATVARVARNNNLADELRILVRRYRYNAYYDLSIEEIIRICLEAASSHPSIDEWTNFVGDWLTELAFGKLVNNDGEVLYSYIRSLCDLVPELWMTCGRAEAALMAYN